MIDPKAGGNLEISIRNNSTQIQTYRVEPSGEGLEFLPPKSEVSIGPTDERRVDLRLFAGDHVPVRSGYRERRDWTLKLNNGATLTIPMRVVLLPRGQTVAWSADLDADGAPEWVLESAKVRAVFSAQDGGRMMDLTWKDANLNFLPEGGLFAQSGPVEVRPNGDTLEFIGKGWKRTATLKGSTLTIEQSSALPVEPLHSEKRGNTTLTVEHPSASRATYTLE